MHTRSLALPLTLGATLFAMGCNAHIEMPVAADALPDDKPKGDALPQAPMPRVKKTTAELLVGTWKTVEAYGQPVPETWKLTYKFTEKGKVRLHVDDQKNSPRDVEGIYELKGDVVTITNPSEDAHNPVSICHLKLVTITENELITLSNAKGSEREVWKRVSTK